MAISQTTKIKKKNGSCLRGVCDFGREMNIHARGCTPHMSECVLGSCWIIAVAEGGRSGLRCAGKGHGGRGTYT